MGLRTPPAVSINQFRGGFRSTSDYTDLTDTETNSSENIEYGPDGDLTQRRGSIKLLNTRLVSTGLTSTEPITGHYHFRKLGGSAFDIVMAGDSIFNYNSSTAAAIATSLSDLSQTFWNTAQVQDPRSASDDIVLMTNGIDAIQLWNGSATAILLNSLTSASQVPIGKFILEHKKLIYVANLVDATQVDSPVQVRRSEIGSDGAPNPHRFPDSFFIGGSSRDGELTGQMSLNDQIFYYTQNTIWRFIPGLGDVNDLEQVQSNIGCLAPRSLVSVGNTHVFLSDRGVYSFDGSKITHLSQKVDDIILRDTTQSTLTLSVAQFDYEKNQYILYIPGQGSTRNNRALIFDLRLLEWQPPVTGREVSYISTFLDGNERFRILYGDYLGYLYQDNSGLNDGIATGFNDSVTTATISVITGTSATFPTDNDGLGGLLFNVISGTGEGLSKRIISNTANTITLETPLQQVLDTTSRFTVGGIDSFWKSKDYDFSGHDILKLFRSVTVRLREEGIRNLNMQYIIDFTKLPASTLKQISMFIDGWAWGTSIWGQNRWGRKQNFLAKVSLRNTSSQKLNGTHMALRFSNRRANEEYKITGMDVEMVQVGKR